MCGCVKIQCMQNTGRGYKYTVKGDKYMDNTVTMELLLELFKRGTATVLHGGKIYFKKEKSR